jgi:hydrogenase maturation protease
MVMPSKASRARPDVRIVGLGSPHGDDQVGWLLIDRLRQVSGLGAKAIALVDPTALLDCLDGCDRLVVVDASRSGRQPGTITRLPWPTASLPTCPARSSHGLPVGAVLTLADRLGRLPAAVVLFGIEIESWEPASPPGAAVTRALAGLQEQIVREVGSLSPVP